MKRTGVFAMLLSLLAGGCCTNKVPLSKLPQPAESVKWHGYTRHNFLFEGRKAFIVDPKKPAGDGRWSWCAIWPEAFVERVAIPDLLALGYYHAHIDVLPTAASPEGVAVMKRFHDYLVSLGLAKKVNLIGMSWGGFFSLRYSETYPDDVAAIYLDAPVCNAADPDPFAQESRCGTMRAQFSLTDEDFKTSKLNPINNLDVIVEHHIPMLAATGEDDQVVRVATNINIVEAKVKALGGDLPIIRRPAWGHHPHGMDDRTPLIEFHQSVHQ